MIRFLLALLLLHFSLTGLISCTLEETDEDHPVENEEAGAATPVEEGEAAPDAAAAKGSGEDELEAELDKEGQTTAEQVPENPPPAAEELEPAPLEKSEQSGDLEKGVADQDLKEEPPPPAAPVQSEVVPAPQPLEDKPPAQEKAQVRDIRFMSNPNGGTVVIETSKPVTYQSRLNPATQQFVIEMADVDLPAALQRPYDMKEFGSKFGSINAYQGAGSNTARVVIQMSGAVSGEPLVQQEGTSLIVVPPSAPLVAASTPTPPPPVASEQPEPNGALAARTLDEFLTGNQKFYGRPISLQIKDADVRDVVNFLAEESGANIIMSDDVSGKISLKLRKIPWDQALVTIMRSKGLGYVRQGNVLRISTLKTLQADTEAANKMLDAQKTAAPATVQVIPFSYAQAEDVLKAVQPFLTLVVGKAVIDKTSSTLIVTDKAEVVDRIAKLVRTIDIRPQQVSIESKVVEAIEGFSNFVGITWGAGGSPVQLSPGGGAYGSPVFLNSTMGSVPISSAFSAGSANIGMSVGVLDLFGNLSASLALAERESLAKVISAPRISTMNREKSTIIQQGENVAVITTVSPQTGTLTKQEKRTPFKLELDVTPQITFDGGVIMDFEVTREFLGAVVDAELQSAPVNSRKAHSKILLRNGQTAVVGGIYTSDETEATNGIPVLRNIPILGWLFKNRSITRDKNELLIFMTPRIIANDAGGGDQASLNPLPH